MQNLNLILVLSLISFSFQSDSCLKTFKICSSDRAAVKAPYKSIDKYIVYDENGDYCTQCKTGYATSDDGENCISFQNCIDLGNGNEECGTYYDGYYINVKRSILIIVLLKMIADVLVAYMILFNLMMMVNAFYQQHLLKDEQVMIAMEIATNAMIVMNLKIIVVNSKNVKKGIPLFLIAEFAKFVIIWNTQMEIVLNLVKEKSILTLILI